ncbi:putative solute carrier family 35 member [Colletotrichum spaethianum]|uniref:Sm protein F n=1 Tax=Colletotrichum spaethianum TaxID=700344 RepID=A0AA37LGM8_9PEZI|nr:putative solute carrier family 35 member [Colletotrichum spaethianum]GKT47109.1 putative solute carrier family 35 member [Colletotrichum spaethianum]
MSFVPINPRPMLQDLYVLPAENATSRRAPESHPHLIATDNGQLANISPLCSVNQDVVVRLKWGETEYKGKLVSIDSYMNVQLSGAEEYIDQKMTGALGQVLIRYATSFGKAPYMDNQLTRYRCNNVLWIRGAKQGENGDVKMEG